MEIIKFLKIVNKSYFDFTWLLKLKLIEFIENISQVPV